MNAKELLISTIAELDEIKPLNNIVWFENGNKKTFPASRISAERVSKMANQYFKVTMANYTTTKDMDSYFFKEFQNKAFDNFVKEFKKESDIAFTKPSQSKFQRSSIIVISYDKNNGQEMVSCDCVNSESGIRFGEIVENFGLIGGSIHDEFNVWNTDSVFVSEEQNDN